MPQRVVFNLNGRKFEIGKEIFMKFIDCQRLELPEAETSQAKSAEYFFQRHAVSFEVILDYLQHGNLHMPPNICPATFKRELKFWGIDARVMSPCCYRKYLSFFSDEKALQKFSGTKEEDSSSRNKSVGFRARVWQVLDNPSSSMAAKIFLGVSTLFVLLSLFALAASTHKAFQRDLDSSEWKEVLGSEKYDLFKDRLPHFGMLPPLPRLRSTNRPSRRKRSPTHCHCHCGNRGSVSLNDTDVTTSSPNSTTESPDSDSDLSTDSLYAKNDYLTYIEYATAVYFTLELLLRFCFAPGKLHFFSSVLNIMDIIALLAMYASILVFLYFPAERYKNSVADWIDGLQVVRVFRIFRIAKDVLGFRVLLYSVKSSIREIFLLILYLSIGTVLFSSVVYFMERENMESIPDAAWWVVVTMTTVGYGDMAPISIQGKIVGCMCAISGVFLIAVTVPIFVSNFMLFYSYSKVVGEMNEAVAACGHTDRQNGGKEVVKAVRPGSMTKNKIGIQDAVVVEDYTARF